MRSWVGRGVVFLILAGAGWRGASAVTFYVDAVKGDDAQNGTSAETAWASLDKVNAHKFGPGDQLLFRAGETWTGTLAPKGSGTAEASILLSSYGDGPKPAIAGAGAAQALMLSDISHWTVRGLAVTNHGKTVGIRSGVEIHVAYVPVVEGIHLVDVDISDVNGDVHSKSAGGIGILGWDKNGKAVRFDDLVVEHCTIRHADGQGIWFHMKGSGDAEDDSEIEDGSANGGRGYPISHLRITGTIIEDTGRNAVFLRDAVGAVFDHNVVLHSSARTHGNAVVVAWSKDTVVRENEVAFTGQGQGGGENGGFDADDGAVGTIFEYNWTHDNAGGSVNVVMDPHTIKTPNNGTIIRYNLSENDGVRAYAVGGPVTNVLYLNNTVFIGKGRTEQVLGFGRFVKHKPGDPDRIVFVNNVIYAEGEAGYQMEATHVAVDSNCWFGKQSGAPKDAHGVKSDPGFVRDSLPVKSWAEMVNYRVSAGSECAGSGVRMLQGGARDLVGTDLSGRSKLDRGAVASAQ